MKKRFALTAAMAAAIAVVTAGCSAGSAQSSSGGSTITYWASNQGTSLDNDKQVLTPVLEEFTKQSGIEVKLEVIGWNDLQTRIQTAVTSGQAPDVLNIGNTWAASLQATGAFLPFDEENMAAIGGADKFVETALQTGGAAGEDPTSVPLYGLAYGLYYNKQLFADAGVTAPTSWEEMVAAAEAVTSGDTHGFALAAGSYTENAHLAFISAAQNGASFFDKEGKPTFTSKEVVAGIKRYVDLMQADKVVDASNAQYDNASKAINDFATGKVGMIVSQNNAGVTIAANGMSPDQYGVVPLPAPVGGEKVASHVAGINLSIVKNTNNKAGALELVKYLTSEPAQAALGKPFASIPVLKDVAPNFSDNADEAKVFQEVYNSMSKPLPLVPAEDQFESTVGKAMNDMFARIATGGSVTESDIKSALKTAQDQVEQSIG
jgi:multiple sugar transport system substrate-binding protein